jgi:hypothetical protein
MEDGGLRIEDGGLNIPRWGRKVNGRGARLRTLTGGCIVGGAEIIEHNDLIEHSHLISQIPTLPSTLHLAVKEFREVLAVGAAEF